MCIEFLSPRGTRIRKKYVDVIRRLFDLGDQSFDISYLRAICRYRYSLGAWSFVGQRIEGCASLIAGCGFAGGDVDFRAASLKEAE